MTRHQLKLVRLALRSIENGAHECAKTALKAALKSHEDKLVRKMQDKKQLTREALLAAGMSERDIDGLCR